MVRKKKRPLRNQLPEIISIQCKDMTLKNKRCRKKTRRSGHCWIHLSKYRNLRIKKSTIPNSGFGLFASKKAFNRGDLIDKYPGRIIKNKALDRTYKNHPKYKGLAPYSLCDGIEDDSWCVNANRSSDGPVRYANDKSLNAANMHPKIVNKKLLRMETYASKRIKPQQEIFMSYGRNYWNNAPFRKTSHKR